MSVSQYNSPRSTGRGVHFYQLPLLAIAGTADRRKHLISIACAVGILTFGFEMSGLRAEEIDNEREYRACMTEAVANPGAAYVKAVRWRDLGGGNAADHCAASAKIGMGQYKDGAQHLEKLAQNGKVKTELKAQLLGQAAQGWLLADEPERAEASASAALALVPNRPEFLIDRAQAMAARKNYGNALNDLDRAIALDSDREDAFVFRATAKRFLDDLDGAMADIKVALILDNNHVDGLLERGILHRLQNNKDAARRDWLLILSLEPDSAAAVAAQKNLEFMDVKAQ